MESPRVRGLLNVREAARYLDVSPSTISRWIAKAKLPAVRLAGHGLRVREDDLKVLVKQVQPSTVTTPASPPKKRQEQDGEIQLVDPKDIDRAAALIDPDERARVLEEVAGSLKGRIDVEEFTRQYRLARSQRTRRWEVLPIPQAE